MHVFHYHLVTSELRRVEQRYLGKLGFGLVARYGQLGSEPATFESGISWEDLDRIGFEPRLTELQRGAVNVVIQPGTWRMPRIDHLGVVLDIDSFDAVLDRATEQNLRIQERDGRRTFVSLGSAFRLEIHPPREWIEDLLSNREELRILELQLRAEDPAAKARALAGVLGLEASIGSVTIGWTTVRFVGGGPRGRPELEAERLV